MSQNLPRDGFEWVEHISQINKDFTENYNKEIDEEYFVEADANNETIQTMISEKNFKLMNNTNSFLENL